MTTGLFTKFGLDICAQHPALHEAQNELEFDLASANLSNAKDREELGEDLKAIVNAATPHGKFGIDGKEIVGGEGATLRLWVDQFRSDLRSHASKAALQADAKHISQQNGLSGHAGQYGLEDIASKSLSRDDVARERGTDQEGGASAYEIAADERAYILQGVSLNGRSPQPELGWRVMPKIDNVPVETLLQELTIDQAQHASDAEIALDRRALAYKSRPDIGQAHTASRDQSWGAGPGMGPWHSHEKIDVRLGSASF